MKLSLLNTALPTLGQDQTDFTVHQHVHQRVLGGNRPVLLDLCHRKKFTGMNLPKRYSRFFKLSYKSKSSQPFSEQPITGIYHKRPDINQDYQQLADGMGFKE